MPKETMGSTLGPEELSLTLKEIEKMRPYSKDKVFLGIYRSKDQETMEGQAFSEENALRRLQAMIEDLIQGGFRSNKADNKKRIRDNINDIKSILNSDVMKTSPYRQKYRDALQELADKAGYDIRE